MNALDEQMREGRVGTLTETVARRNNRVGENLSQTRLPDSCE